MESATNSFFIAEDLSNEILESDLSKFFENAKFKVSKIEITKNTSSSSAKIYFDKKDADLSILEELDGKTIKDNTSLKIRWSESETNSSSTVNNKFAENEPIQYNLKYNEHCASQFIQAPGDTYLKFIDLKTIEKQRGVITHFLSKMGSNLLSGSGIMNVSLPINIFDQRSLLEVFAHQCRLAPYFLEKVEPDDSAISKMKMTTAFALTRIHLSMTQLKPFNPIWGETFQCKIGDTSVYLEQTSHHPPCLGKNYKSYGFQEPQASTGTNSITSKTRGVYYIEYKDGTKHIIQSCNIVITGTLIGDRTFSLTDNLVIIDEQNDFISIVEFDPDDRNSFTKMFSKKKTFPDYFKGCITRLSHTNCSNNNYSLKKNYTSFAEVKGEWTKNLYIDDVLYWSWNDYVHFDLLRMAYTLPSDSTLREDLSLLKSGNEEAAGESKVKFEDMQRKDRKLRAKHTGKSH